MYKGLGTLIKRQAAPYCILLFTERFKGMDCRIFPLITLLLSSYCHPKSARDKALWPLVQAFEAQLLYSHEKAMAIAAQIEKEASKTNFPAAAAIVNYTQALQYLEIEQQADTAKIWAKKAFKTH
ncbi:MAG: hypothetical protein AAGF77_07225 [Bacteroidota bacterium]